MSDREGGSRTNQRNIYKAMDKPGDGQAEQGHILTLTTNVDNLAFSQWDE
jgi:hypothetical protein